MKTHIAIVLFVALLLPALAVAQVDTVVVLGWYETSGVEGTLNTAINDAKTAGKLSTTVFKLKNWERYILVETITIPLGERLTIVADEAGTTQESAPPQILWTASGSPSRSFIFDCFGDITLKNLWILFADLSGTQYGTSIRIEDTPDTINGQHGTFENVIFDYSQIGADGSGAVSVTARHFRGRFTNSYFRNCSDVHFRYYGRAVSFPFQSTGWHTDSLTFVNCSFSNLGYVIMQEGSEYTDYLSFNHCTFINTVMFGLESTWWHWLAVTNSIFLNMYMYGDLGDNGGNPFGGTFAIDSVSNFGFTPPFTDQQRHIIFTNSSHATDQWLVDYMASNPYTDTVKITNPIMVPKPMPMLGPRTLMFFDTTDGFGNKAYPLMCRANLYDGVNPNFPVPPTNIECIKRFLCKKWTDNADTNWAFSPATAIDFTWPLPENMRVPTISPLKTAGMGGFPLGDLYRWDKTRYSLWKAQEGTENSQIQTWLTGGIVGVEDPLGLPTRFELSQNYPNPFNPVTAINYSIAQPGHISLKVYDLIGREVATLFDGEQTIGNFSVEFDGAKFASGVYFYRLQSGGISATRKLVLMK